MEIKTTTYQKIGLVYGVLVILIVIALVVRYFQAKNLQKSTVTQPVLTYTQKSKSKPSYVGKLTLSAPQTTIKAGESVPVTIYFEASGKTLDGADVILLYNPQIISALGFSEANYFKLYPRKDVDNAVGTVKITGVDSSGSPALTSEKVALGTVTFQGQSAGVAQINFDFALGATTKTNLTEHGTSENILGNAQGLTIKVEP